MLIDTVVSFELFTPEASQILRLASRFHPVHRIKFQRFHPVRHVGGGVPLGEGVADIVELDIGEGLMLSAPLALLIVTDALAVVVALGDAAVDGVCGLGGTETETETVEVAEENGVMFGVWECVIDTDGGEDIFAVGVILTVAFSDGNTVSFAAIVGDIDEDAEFVGDGFGIDDGSLFEEGGVELEVDTEGTEEGFGDFEVELVGVID